MWTGMVFAFVNKQIWPLIIFVLLSIAAGNSEISCEFLKFCIEQIAGAMSGQRLLRSVCVFTWNLGQTWLVEKMILQPGGKRGCWGGTWGWQKRGAASCGSKEQEWRLAIGCGLAIWRKQRLTQRPLHLYKFTSLFKFQSMWVCEHPASLEATQVLSRMRTSETESADVCFSWGIYRFLSRLR